MKKSISLKTFVVAAVTLVGVACKKDNTPAVESAETVLQEEVSSSQAIAIAAVTTSSSSSSARKTSDSLYVVNVCSKRSRKDSIAFSSLPATSLSYLTTNYAGYTATKAYSIKDTAGTVTGYVAIISFNSKPVGVLFDAAGAFVRVLEQREGADLTGSGWHSGGSFEDRGEHKRDTVALSALPAVVTSYYSTNYPSDTLVVAVKNGDSSIVVLSKNNGIFATVFSSTGTFIQRVELPSKPGKANSVDESALPATVQSYLTATYPNYVFKRAFKVVANGSVTGYVVFIDANATKYAVEFDASGNFVKAVTVR